MLRHEVPDADGAYPPMLTAARLYYKSDLSAAADRRPPRRLVLHGVAPASPRAGRAFVHIEIVIRAQPRVRHPPGPWPRFPTYRGRTQNARAMEAGLVRSGGYWPASRQERGRRRRARCWFCAEFLW